MLITTISALIIGFFLSGLIFEDVLSSIILITGISLSGIIVYFLQKLKRNSSLSTKFKLLITYILGGMTVVIFPSIYTVIAELFLFLMVIIATNRVKQIKGRITLQ
jgi:hypothetical protein